jgi:hypothetical protein
MQLLIELLQLAVLDLVGRSEFGDLLGHEVDVGLVLAGKALLLQLDLVEALMKRPQLASVQVSRLLDSVQQSSDALVTLSYLILQLLHVPLMVLPLLFSQSVLLTQVCLEICLISPQTINCLAVACLQVTQLARLNLYQLFPERKEFKLALSLRLVNLILE